MLIKINKIDNQHYQINDSDVPIDYTSLFNLMINLDIDDIEKVASNLDKNGYIEIEDKKVANKGTVVNVYEVNYPPPKDPNKESQQVIKYLDEYNDAISQQIFPGIPVEDIVITTQENLETLKKENTIREQKNNNIKNSWKEYPKEVYDFEEYLNKHNIEYHLEGDTFVITHKGDLEFYGITELPENIDFRNIGNLTFNSLKRISENTKFNNNGNVDLFYINHLPRNIYFNNTGDVYLEFVTYISKNVIFNNTGNIYLIYIKSLPDNKYEIFKNDGIVYYDRDKKFNPKDKLENKISFKEYPKEVYDFEDYLNKHNIEYHLEGDTFVITHKGKLIFNDIKHIPKDIDFRNDGYVDFVFVKQLSENTKFNNNGNVFIDNIVSIPNNVKFNNNGDVDLYNLKEIPKNITFNNKGNIHLHFIKSLPDNKYEIFKNDGFVYYNKERKWFDPRKGLENKISFKEYPKEVYNFEDYLNKHNIEYHLEGDTFVITHKGNLIIGIDNLPDNIDFRNNGYVDLISIKYLPDSIEFNNNGFISFSYLKEIPKNITFNNNGDIYLYSVKDLPDNKYEIFKNDGIVYYDKEIKEFDPRKGLEDKLSFKEYPKEVYDFEDYLNKRNIEYHLEGDTFVITHKGDLDIGIDNLPENIDFRNDGYVDLIGVKYLPNNIKFNNNGYVSFPFLKKLSDSIEFNNNGNVNISDIKEIPENIKFNNKGDIWLYYVKSLPNNKYEIFKNDGIVHYNYYIKQFDPIKGLESKLSFKEYPKEVYDFEDFLNKNNIEYHLEGDTFVITNKGYLEISGIGNIPENIDFRNDGNVAIVFIKRLPKNIKFNNNGYVDLYHIKYLSEGVTFNNNGNVDIYNLITLPKNVIFNNRGNIDLFSTINIPKNVEFNNKGNIYLDSIRSLPDNKYEIFKNDGIVYYDGNTKQFDPKNKLEVKMSWKEKLGIKLRFKNIPKTNNFNFFKKSSLYKKSWYKILSDVETAPAPTKAPTKTPTKTPQEPYKEPKVNPFKRPEHIKPSQEPQPKASMLKFSEKPSLRIHPEIENSINKKDTPYHAIPQIPGGDFLKNIANDRFKIILKNLEKYSRTKINNVQDVMFALMSILQKINNIESENSDQLEDLAVSLVIHNFGIDPREVGFDAKLVRNVELSDVTNITYEKEQELEKVLPNLDVDLEASKRRFINGLIQGAGINSLNMFYLIKDELNKIDPELINLYGLLNVFIELGYWLIPSLVNKNSGGFGGGKVKLDFSNEDKPIIVAVALNFPILVQELVKGVMELISSHGLPKDDNIRNQVLKKADTLEDESWDIRFGPEIWKKLLSAIKTTDEINGRALSILYYNLVQMDAASFSDFVYKILSNNTEAVNKWNQMYQEALEQV